MLCGPSSGALHAAEELDDALTRACQVALLQLLLADTSPMVLSSAAAAFMRLCPARLELLHPHFFSLCHRLPQLDQWGQANTIV